GWPRAERCSLVPDMPTIGESGIPGFEASLFYGIVAPAGTPRVIIDKLNEALRAALASDDVRQRLATDGAEPTPSTPEEYADHIDKDETRWSAVVKASGAKGGRGHVVLRPASHLAVVPAKAATRNHTCSTVPQTLRHSEDAACGSPHSRGRQWCSIATFVALALFAMPSAIPAHAQDYPSRTITLVVPYAAGGGNDLLARIASEKMSKT